MGDVLGRELIAGRLSAPGREWRHRARWARAGLPALASVTVWTFLLAPPPAAAAVSTAPAPPPAAAAEIAAAPAASPALTSAGFDVTSAWRAVQAGQPGHLAVAMFDARTGLTAGVDDPAVTGFETASVVKLSILTALLLRAGPAGLSAAQRRDVAAMISVSDNDAASRLWAELGGAAAMNQFFQRLGMTVTTAGTGGAWGLTRTTPLDQLQLLRTVSYPNAILPDAARAMIAGLLGQVVPGQRWGIPDGVPAGAATVLVKNGWLPRSGGWVIGGVGHVQGAGRDYVIAVLTDGEPSMASGVAALREASALAWRAAAVATVTTHAGPA